MNKIIMLAVTAFVLTKSPAFAAKPEGKTIADLPPAAQMAVSEAMGRDNAAYHATKIKGGYEIKAGHDLTARFRSDHAVVSGWDLSLAGVGRGNVVNAPLSAMPTSKANRVEYRRGDVTEWYINGPLGLEQGFTLERAPEGKGNGPLTLTLGLPEDMKAEITQNRTDVALTGKEGGQTIGYGRLAAWDATGKNLDAWFELSTASLALHIRVDDRGARYPITVDPMIQRQKLTASDSVASEYFGASVSLSSDGNTALIGDFYNNVGSNSDQGAAYVFVRSGSVWSEQQKLTASDGAANDKFGSSVSLSSDGSTALIGAYWKNVGSNSLQGAAYVCQERQCLERAAETDRL